MTLSAANTATTESNCMIYSKEVNMIPLEAWQPISCTSTVFSTLTEDNNDNPRQYRRCPTLNLCHVRSNIHCTRR
jgi:hypothetical protein